MTVAAECPRGARAVSVAAQAKINLRLRILAREAGGFHQIETLFLRLELADTIRIRRRASGLALEVIDEVGGSVLGAPERNLAWRAAAAYREEAGSSDGYAIELEKRIPIGAGLGGGSADAGAVLRALDAMATVPLGEARLHSLATRLGADVAFLTGTASYALGWGRGERLLALDPLPSRLAVLFVPPFGVNTADAYGWLAAARASALTAPPSDSPLALDVLGDWSRLEQLVTNDFEQVVAARHPEILDIVAALRADGCRIAQMSGSGSTVFGILPAGAVRVAPAGDRDALPVGTPLMTRTASRVEPVSLLD